MKIDGNRPNRHLVLESTQETGTKEPAANQTPVIDQHALPHYRNWSFCGIASTMMVMQANGKPIPRTNADLERFKQGIYITGAGSSGAGMAERLRPNGLDSARYTTSGTVSDITRTLDKGQPVPMGVVSMGGVVKDVPGGRSVRYPGLRPGDRINHQFGASGHWVVVSGYTSALDNPKSFLVNDPNTGARIEMTPSELKRHAAAHEGIWMIAQ